MITGTLGAPILRQTIDRLGRTDVGILEVPNQFFGGNIGVTGLLTASDLNEVLAPNSGLRYVLPDICLNEGRFLDGMSLDDLVAPVEVVATTGVALSQLLAAAPKNREEVSV